MKASRVDFDDKRRVMPRAAQQSPDCSVARIAREVVPSCVKRTTQPPA